MTWIMGIQPDSNSNYFGVTILKNNVENKTFWLWNLTWKWIAGGNGVFDWLFTLMKRNKLSQIWLSLGLWFFFFFFWLGFNLGSHEISFSTWIRLKSSSCYRCFNQTGLATQGERVCAPRAGSRCRAVIFPWTTSFLHTAGGYVSRVQRDEEKWCVSVKGRSSSVIKWLLELREFMLGESQVQYAGLHFAEGIIQVLF